MDITEPEPWEIALQQMRAEYARRVPWRSATELQDEVVWAYGRCEQTLQEKRRTMEAWIRMKDGQCLVNRVVLQVGTLLEITPTPGLWLPGHYGYDPDHQEHYWKADDEHFVGLLDGMKVRIS